MSRSGGRPRALRQRVRVVVAATVAALGLAVAGAAPAWAHDWELTQPTLTVGEGVEFSGVVSCIEPVGGGSFDTADFEGTINWGDGTTTAATIASDFNSSCFIDVRGTHTYAVAGSYDLFVSVVDLTLDRHFSFGYQGTATVTVVPNDLGVGLGASPNPVRTSKNLTYEMQVVNGGSSIASGVTATLALPAGTQFVSMSPSTATCLAPAPRTTGTITCEIGAMAGKATWTFRAVVKVLARGGSSIEAVARVSADDPDPFSANNSATVSTSVFGRR
jgi:uncharacterized repeat protein (TIGR01451 family)